MSQHLVGVTRGCGNMSVMSKSSANGGYIKTLVADACECGNEPSDSVKCREFLG